MIMVMIQGSIAQNSAAEQEIITLSKDKWQWMEDKNVEGPDKLFHEESMFVHMGGTLGKQREIEGIESGYPRSVDKNNGPRCHPFEQDRSVFRC